MPIRTLIADDHAVFRSGLKALLEKEADIEVVAETGDGLATINEACALNVDLLLLDISMPGLPGPKVAESILKERPDLKEKLREHGIANVTVLTQAPTGTTGTITGYSSGCEPYFAMAYTRNSNVGVIVDGCPSFMDWLEEKGIDYKEYNYDLNAMVAALQEMERHPLTGTVDRRRRMSADPSGSRQTKPNDK